jgi:hypothetical protein
VFNWLVWVNEVLNEWRNPHEAVIRCDLANVVLGSDGAFRPSQDWSFANVRFVDLRVRVFAETMNSQYLLPTAAITEEL